MTAAPMWRMNGLWTRIVVLGVLLLLSGEVRSQDDAATDATDAPAADPADPTDAVVATDPADPAAPDATPSPALDAAATDAAAAEQPASTVPPFDGSFSVSVFNFPLNPDSQDGGSSGTLETAAPAINEDVATAGPSLGVPDDSDAGSDVDIRCVGKEDIRTDYAVKAEVATTSCEDSKRIIEAISPAWCDTRQCGLDIFQEGTTMWLSSNSGSMTSEKLSSEVWKNKLGVTKVEAVRSPPGPGVFVGILVSGLLAALLIFVGYLKCQRRSEAKGVRLAEEAYPVDQENQGNTLVSVAPLNPPPETQEKPSVNGESPEAAKTPAAPPTNGHSTTKTADTEL
ncbi:uncharacterized protein V6R79_003175 [Siganus canaliculatus]